MNAGIAVNILIFIIWFFLYSQGTPCCFTATLRRLCPKFWLVAKGKRTIGGDLNMQTKHHIFLDENRHNFELCGPYWRSLVEAFCVEFGDTVIFTLQKDEYEDNKWFNIRVISEDNLGKPLHGYPGIYFLNIYFIIVLLFFHTF